MGSFYNRVKLLRLRWKIGAVLIVLSLAGLVALAKRPQYSLTLQKVEQHGEWLRLEFDLTNLTRHPAEVWEIQESGLVYLALWYKNEQPDPMNQTEFPLSVTSRGFVHPASWRNSLIAPGETKKAEYEIHRALGDNEVAALCLLFILPEESFHRKVRNTISTIERNSGSFRLGQTLTKLADIFIFPEPEMTDFFIPNQLEAKVIEPRLSVQIRNLIAQPIPETVAYISDDEGMEKLNNFLDSDDTDFSFDDYENWLSKIDRIIAEQMWQEIDTRKALKISGQPIPENSSEGSEYLFELRRLVKMIPAHLFFVDMNKEIH